MFFKILIAALSGRIYGDAFFYIIVFLYWLNYSPPHLQLAVIIKKIKLYNLFLLWKKKRIYGRVVSEALIDGVGLLFCYSG